jgi:hypothetical protein
VEKKVVDWKKYLNKTSGAAPKDVHDNMVDDLRLEAYKGVYHHYGHNELNDAPAQQELLDIALVPPFKHKGIKENHDWALSFTRGREAVPYKAIESEHSPRLQRSIGRGAKPVQDDETSSDQERKQDFEHELLKYKDPIHTDENNINHYEYIADALGAECETPADYHDPNECFAADHEDDPLHLNHDPKQKAPYVPAEWTMNRAHFDSVWLFERISDEREKRK